MHTIVAVTLLTLLGPTGLAVAHELPGRGCEHAADGKNKHCGPHAHGSDGFGDRDGDGIRAERDNCDEAYNPNQADMDGDGTGNVCDHFLDSNEDGTCDAGAPELCGTAESGEKGEYGPDSDGDGFSDEDEDALAPPS
jgi:hypothetical protein